MVCPQCCDVPYSNSRIQNFEDKPKVKIKVYTVADAITELRVIAKNGFLSHPTGNDVTNGLRDVKLGYSQFDLA